jgi:hypothetical protein
MRQLLSIGKIRGTYTEVLGVGMDQWGVTGSEEMESGEGD